MPRITRIYTKTGDAGTTRLGGGQEVSKDDARIATYGTVDELNSAIGVVRAHGVDEALDRELGRIQNELFHLGSDLCFREEDKKEVPVPTVRAEHVAALEAAIDRCTAEAGPLENFVLPGGTVAASHLHQARTVCRRAERLLVTLGRHESVNPEALRYLNRLSDALFALARVANVRAGVADMLWDSRA